MTSPDNEEGTDYTYSPMESTTPDKAHTTVSALLKRSYVLVQRMDNTWILAALNPKGDAVDFFFLDHFDITDDMEVEDPRVIRNYQL